MAAQRHQGHVCGHGNSSPRPLPVVDRRSLVDVDDAEHLPQRLQFVAVTLGDPVHRTSPSIRQMHLDISSVHRAAVQAWVNELWQAKDEEITQLLAPGKTPTA